MPLRPRREPPAGSAGIGPTPTPEPELIERVRAGDAASYEALFKTYYRSLCTFVNGYVRSGDTAEELVQTVFLRIWENRANWTPVAGVRAYVYAACRNAALDQLRHDRVVERAGAHGASDYERKPGIGAGPPGPDEALEATELSEALRRAVQELPERRRAVLVLRWQHHLTNEEIARALGITVKGVEAHVSRSLASLRERLRPYRP